MKAFQRTPRVVLATAQLLSLREFSRRAPDPRQRSLKRYLLRAPLTIMMASRVAGSARPAATGWSDGWIFAGYVV